MKAEITQIAASQSTGESDKAVDLSITSTNVNNKKDANDNKISTMRLDNDDNGTNEPINLTENNNNGNNEDNGDGYDLLVNKRPKRTVKQVVPFSYEVKESKSRSRKRLDNIGQGLGTPLGEIPTVLRNINRLKYNDDVLKGLHKLFYGTVGMKNEIKSNIRRFSGFSNATPVDEIVIKEKLEKWKLIGLKNMCTVFNLKASGDKGAIIDRLYNWLINPKEVTGSDESKAQKKIKLSPSSSLSKKSKVPRKKSARDIFMSEKRPLYRAMEEHQSKNRVDIDRILSEAWKSVSDEEKKGYEEKAKEENIRTGKAIISRN